METKKLERDWHRLLFSVRRSVRYHMRRQRFFDTWRTFTSIISVVFGSATVALILGKMGVWWLAAPAMTVTFFSGVDLVVGTARAARSHNDLARRFIELEKHIVSVADPTDDDLRHLTSQRLTIEADEPPILRNLDALCHNEMMRAMGYAEKDALKVGPLQRALAQFFDWRHNAIQPGTGSSESAE